MAKKSGIDAQLGIGTETTYGTRVAPTTFLEFTQESLRLSYEYIKTQGIRTGRLGQADGLHSQTTRSVAGSLSGDVRTTGMGKLLNLLHGDTVTPTGAGTEKTQTHNIGVTAPDGKSITVQVGRPSVNGTVHTFEYEGVKCLGATFACERSGVLTYEFELAGEDETTAQTLATPTYAAVSDTFIFTGSSVEFDDVVLADCVQSASVSIELPHAIDRFCLGGGGVMKEPILNGPIAVTASLTAEFSSLAQHNAFKNATRRKLELNFTRGNSQFNITLPTTVTVGQPGPVVEGPDLLTQELTLEATQIGTGALASIVYISTDTSL
jgi:hypothetical protein